MTAEVVSNASPLIYAAKIGFFETLIELYGKISLPPAVYNEAVEKGYLRVLEPNERAKAETEVLTKTQDISAGEAEAIALARQVKAELLIIDERSGTLIARVWRIRTVGLLGVIIEAMHRDIITFDELKMYYDRPIETEFRLRHRDYVKAMELAQKVWRETKKREQKNV